MLLVAESGKEIPSHRLTKQPELAVPGVPMVLPSIVPVIVEPVTPRAAVSAVVANAPVATVSLVMTLFLIE